MTLTTEELADEMIKLAQERIDAGFKYHNINAAIHEVSLEISNILMKVMKYIKS